MFVLRRFFPEWYSPWNEIWAWMYQASFWVGAWFPKIYVTYSSLQRHGARPSLWLIRVNYGKSLHRIFSLSCLDPFSLSMGDHRYCLTNISSVLENLFLHQLKLNPVHLIYISLNSLIRPLSLCFAKFLANFPHSSIQGIKIISL